MSEAKELVAKFLDAYNIICEDDYDDIFYEHPFEISEIVRSSEEIQESIKCFVQDVALYDRLSNIRYVIMSGDVNGLFDRYCEILSEITSYIRKG